MTPILHTSDLLREALAQGSAYELLRGLCDEVGPRYPCTPGDAAGVAWALAAMQRAGLANARAEAAPATLWERGVEACTLHLPRRQPVVITALGGSVPTPAGGLSAPVIELPSLDALDAADAGLVAGKVVYLHHVMPKLRDGTGYNAASVVRTAGPSRAAKKGALACLVRSAGTDSMRAAHTGALFYEPGVTPIPAAALATPDADLLHRALASNKPVHVDLALGCTPLPVGTSNNVVGELPGTDLADEIVLFGAHLDSWDLGTGALDDGAGCAVALEVARLIASLPVRPRRTVRIASLRAELGIGGGLACAERYAAEAKRHFVAMEADRGDGHRGLCASRRGRALGALGRGSRRSRLDFLRSTRAVARRRRHLPLRQLGVHFVDLGRTRPLFRFLPHDERRLRERRGRHHPYDSGVRVVQVLANAGRPRTYNMAHTSPSFRPSSTLNAGRHDVDVLVAQVCRRGRGGSEPFNGGWRSRRRASPLLVCGQIRSLDLVEQASASPSGRGRRRRYPSGLLSNTKARVLLGDAGIARRPVSSFSLYSPSSPALAPAEDAPSCACRSPPSASAPVANKITGERLSTLTIRDPCAPEVARRLACVERPQIIHRLPRSSFARKSTRRSPDQASSIAHLVVGPPVGSATSRTASSLISDGGAFFPPLPGHAIQEAARLRSCDRAGRWPRLPRACWRETGLERRPLA
ncbi:MAG: M28 family peptidase [Polyangiaceae bacterium]